MTKKNVKTMRTRRTPKVTRTDSPTASKVRKPLATLVSRTAAIKAVPNNWLDSLLSGPDAVIGNWSAFTCDDIERICDGIRRRMAAL